MSTTLGVDLTRVVVVVDLTRVVVGDLTRVVARGVQGVWTVWGWRGDWGWLR